MAKPTADAFLAWVALPALVWLLAAGSGWAARARHGVEVSPSPSPSVSASPVARREFDEEIERDFTLRSIGQLQITNLRGAIAIQGWAQDKIRVKARRRVQAENAEEARKLFGTVDFRFKSDDGGIELSAEYGKGLDIGERVRERSDPRTSMEMTVYAPSNLKLKVWSVDDPISVKAWGQDLMVRTTHGQVQIENVRSSEVSVLCDSCGIQLKSVRAAVRTMSSDGGVELADVSGPQIYVESGAGAVTASDVSGDQLYVTKSGMISGRELKGNIEFHTHAGAVEIEDGSGFLSGSTQSGRIVAKMKEWNFTDKAFIESDDGPIQLTLPSDFSGELDVWSVQGHAEIGFPMRALKEPDFVGPEPANHFRGEVGQGGEHLKIYSEQGDVQVLQAP